MNATNEKVIPMTKKPPEMSAAELAILTLYKTGMKYRVIAEKLGITVDDVSTMLNRLKARGLWKPDRHINTKPKRPYTRSKHKGTRRLREINVDPKKLAKVDNTKPPATFKSLQPLPVHTATLPRQPGWVKRLVAWFW